MSDNIISFKGAKKRASYTKKAAQASENRIKFGRTKSEKLKDKFAENKSAQHLDDHKLDDE